MNEQEKLVASWIKMGAVAGGLAKMADATLESIWAGLDAQNKLRMTELFEKHKAFFKENT